MPNFDPKDPDDRDNFSWNFARELGSGETISVAEFPDFPADLTLNSQLISSGAVIANISGGTAGNSYSVLCRITTNQTRQLDFTGTIPVSEQ